MTATLIVDHEYYDTEEGEVYRIAELDPGQELVTIAPETCDVELSTRSISEFVSRFRELPRVNDSYVSAATRDIYYVNSVRDNPSCRWVELVLREDPTYSVMISFRDLFSLFVHGPDEQPRVLIRDSKGNYVVPYPFSMID